MFLCLSTFKFKSRLLFTILVLLIIAPLIGHYYLSKEEKDGFDNSYNSHSKLEVHGDYGVFKATDLKHRIAELVRIKNSVNNELRNIEGKRQKLLSELASNHKKIEDSKAELIRQEAELDKLKISVKQAQVAENEAIIQNSPNLAPPTIILPKNPPSFIPLSVNTRYTCRNMKNCFDYSRCSLTSGFPFYFYRPEELPELVSMSLNKIVFQVLRYNPHFTNNSDNACVYVALIGETHNSINITQLERLPFWGGDGRNNILFYLSKNIYNKPKFDQNINFGRAILAQSFWNENNFRPGHDIMLPVSFGPPGGEVWMDSPYMLPARRKYLLSFEGYKNINVTQHQQNFGDMLQKFITQTTDDQFYIITDCENQRVESNITDWCLCGDETKRKVFIAQSTFTLISAPLDNDMISTAMMQTRIFESLKFGAIPVFLEHDRIGLPFDEVIDWCRAAICIAGERIPELHWLLRTIPDNDILLMRRQGRMLYEKYFGTIQSILDTTLAVIRNRIGIPPTPVIDTPSPSIFNEHFKPIKMDAIIPDAEPEESLGPLEQPFNSPVFKRNHTVMNIHGYELWNSWGDPFKLYPHMPFDPLLPSDAKFIGSGKGFRPINNGAGGAGKEFCQSLGGNSPREQFTIVILTYERDQVLMNSLSRLHGLPYLNKVLVVWNSPKPPLEDLRWPEIGVPIHVIQAAKNSLNNRFLPYEAIETEAVLSVDDDAHLRHDEIMFGFRVWREQRDRVVGFPGRFHALDLNHGGWLYNSNYSCELSMVLTGAAFVHKYYLYLYSYWLPQAIRDKVDQYMNCEDIAMNFLVSHVTNKPPVKVTSRWTFRCPGCPVSLSEDETHFLERHKCINFFTKIFGYTPLLNTQFRVDSILFKTRIPHDKQKCFKFI
ncbi:PREDICTED: exostosin-3 [Diuraphis noxia]|uniref:exostosin-3 n=1 Tax=Diuraphis noxia TaxID=143948 RepID=UPI000763900A|nr:PREDICTED: exostosin-3 [Diuraphis noxia]